MTAPIEDEPRTPMCLGVDRITFVSAPTYSVMLVCASRQQLITGPHHLPSWVCECGSVTQIHLPTANCKCDRLITDDDMARFITAIRVAGGRVRLDLGVPNGRNHTH
jgi:hypothetical protein